ncbi:MAG: methyltransferase [Ignavibacteriae bacterium]|nr:MAG: methyltransferase [Ignavibacteriota bacterium]
MSKILNENIYNYLNNFLSESDGLLSEMEEFAKQNRIPILEKSSAEFLEQLILIKNSKTILEIGTAIAYSSIRIARLLPEGASLDTIELSKNNIKLANSFIKKANLATKINLLEGNAFTIIPKLQNKYDFVFLDADKEDYLNLLELILPKLKTGGILFVDNLLWKGYVAETAKQEIPGKYQGSTNKIREFNDKFVKHCKLKAIILPLGDGIGLAVKL